MPSRGSDCRLESSNMLIVDDSGTKKRRMLCIVVSCLPALFERLMLLDYQIRLNFASGVGLQNIGETDIESATARFLVLLRTKLIGMAFQTPNELCRIRRTYIRIRHSGRALQTSTTPKFCVQLANRIQPLDINQHHPLVWMFSHIVEERLIKSRAGKERIV